MCSRDGQKTLASIGRVMPYREIDRLKGLRMSHTKPPMAMPYGETARLKGNIGRSFKGNEE